jgi:hypothetical protein
MPEADHKTNEELVNTDMFALNDQELKRHIKALQVERNRLKQSVVPSVSECDTLIALALTELSGRISNRKTNYALWLSVTAIVVTCIIAIVQMLVH